MVASMSFQNIDSGPICSTHGKSKPLEYLHHPDGPPHSTTKKSARGDSTEASEGKRVKLEDSVLKCSVQVGVDRTLFQYYRGSAIREEDPN